jgi:DMSO reductase anchor subunit
MRNNNNILIPTTRHEVWGWPAAANFILGGTACGFFLFSLIDTELFQQAKAAIPLFGHHIISPFFVALGFLTVGVEAGSPRRGVFLLHHLKKSWMSREVLAGMLFILFALSDAVQPNIAFKISSATAAAGLMLCQGFMVFRARAITAWSSYLIPCYFITSGLMLGFGFLLFWSTTVGQTTVSAPILFLGLLGLFVNLVFWYMIVRPKRSRIEDRAVIHLRHPLSMTITFGFGHVVPILLVSTILVLTFANSVHHVTYAQCTIAGICILAGGIVQKIAFILQANALCAVISGNPKYHAPYCPGP